MALVEPSEVIRLVCDKIYYATFVWNIKITNYTSPWAYIKSGKGIQKEEIYKILHFKHVWADLLIGKFTSETTVGQLVLFKKYWTYSSWKSEHSYILVDFGWRIAELGHSILKECFNRTNRQKRLIYRAEYSEVSVLSFYYNLTLARVKTDIKSLQKGVQTDVKCYHQSHFALRWKICFRHLVLIEMIWEFV